MISRRNFLGLLAALPGVNYAALPSTDSAPGADTKVTHAKIHPAIGIARVGNSRDEFFIGPEIPEAGSLPLGSYKDKTGAIKRQAARFRIYGYNAAGEVVRELTPDNAVITWTVHLANKKSAWYDFELALDIPEAAQPGATIPERRNPTVAGPDRQKLAIDPGPRTIRGKSTAGEAYQFNTGKFFDLVTPLGELRTDAQGRLLVLGGYGLSRSITGQPPQEFGNNDGWHDDTSDGPVEATVTLDNEVIPVEGAWVVAAPPNYAPALKTVRTLYDLFYDNMIAWGFMQAPAQVSFSRHIAPIFRRLSGLQWVNQGFAALFGHGAPYDADQLLSHLADGAETNRAYRHQIYSQFRNAADNQRGKMLWPPFYGDAVDSFTTQEADPTVRLVRGMSELSKTQLGWLKKWADGDFTNDFSTEKPPPKTLEEMPVSAQPATLDEAALLYCLADAFHPGCELTWVVRARSLYSGPLRFIRRPADKPERDYGFIMTPQIVLSVTGPLTAAGPGDLTRWMAMPWQSDTADCRYSYDFFRISESLPAYWPARVPNEVLTEEDYKIAIDPTKPLPQRVAAFARRRDWFRFLGPEPKDFADMVAGFHKMGVIEVRPGVTDVPQLPTQMMVESKPGFPPV